MRRTFFSMVLLGVFIFAGGFLLLMWQYQLLALAATVIMTVAYAAMAQWRHEDAVRDLTHGKLDQAALDMHPKREIEIPASYADTFELCRQALSQIDAEVTATSREVGYIEVTRITVQRRVQYTDTITLRIHRNDCKTSVQVSSRPNGVIPVFDEGRNLRNVQEIIQLLEVASPT